METFLWNMAVLVILEINYFVTAGTGVIARSLFYFDSNCSRLYCYTPSSFAWDSFLKVSNVDRVLIFSGVTKQRTV